MTFTESQIREVLDRRFSGVLRHGSHEENGEACALEAFSVVAGVPWTDDPVTLGMLDIRGLNDAAWSSDAARTKAMVPLLAALSAWPSWDNDKRVAWVTRVAERTIREVLPIALRAAGLSVEADRCASEGAASAARSAASAADDVLNLACRIWTEEALREQA